MNTNPSPPPQKKQQQRTDGPSSSSLLSAFHPLPSSGSSSSGDAAYPTQRYRLPSCPHHPISATTTTTTTTTSSSNTILLILKPVALDIPSLLSLSQEEESVQQQTPTTEPALVLYGRALGGEEGGSRSIDDGDGGGVIHRLALRVGEFVVAGEGGQGEEEDGRAVVWVAGGAWRCRLGALGDRCVCVFVCVFCLPNSLSLYSGLSLSLSLPLGCFYLHLIDQYADDRFLMTK
jgi:hypothetical protein